MPVTIDVRINGQKLSDFSDHFLINYRDILENTLEIVTIPADSTVIWDLVSDGAHCGINSVNGGTDKTFAFNPKAMVSDRPKNGSTARSRAVRFVLSVTANHATEGEAKQCFEIMQSVRSILRQEYVDFELTPPPLEEVVEAAATTNFTSEDFTRTSNYAPYVVDSGMRDIAQRTRNQYGRELIISSCFRNPRRNKAAGGADRSVHMSGGAVDLVPTSADRNVQGLAELYEAALVIVITGNKLVMLERGPNPLFPSNWRPPRGSHAFVHDGTTITVNDDDGDGLPETVSKIEGAPTDGVLIDTRFAYDGGGTQNPPFVFESTLKKPTLAVGDKLHLFHRPQAFGRYLRSGERWVSLHPGRSTFLLSEYFSAASHVHIDNRRVPQKLGSTTFDPRDPMDPYGTFPQTFEISAELQTRWGDLPNAERLLKSVDSSASPASAVDVYDLLDQRTAVRRGKAEMLLSSLHAIRRSDWGAKPPKVHDMSFDWDYTDIVIHHSGNDGEKEPKEIERLHREERGYADVAYHFMINLNGEIVEGRSLIFKGSHVDGKNTGKIGVLFLGDYHAGNFLHRLRESLVNDAKSDSLNESQLTFAVELILQLKNLFPSLTTLGGHRDYLVLTDYLKQSVMQQGALCPGDELYNKLDFLRSKTGLSKPT